MVRQLHKWLGLVCAPFFLLSLVTGSLLLWRKAELYSKETKGVLVELHTWELIAPYLAILLAAGLLLMTLTGLSLFTKAKKKP